MNEQDVRPRRQFSAFLLDEMDHTPAPSASVVTAPVKKKSRAMTDEDIPVLEKGAFYSDHEDDDDDEDEDDDDADDDDGVYGDDDDDGDDEAEEDELRANGDSVDYDNVAVLQTAEDARKSRRAKSTTGTKKETTTRSTFRKLRDAARRSPKRPRQPSNDPEPPFPPSRMASDPLLSTATTTGTESFVYAPSNAVGNSSTVRQMVRCGWLYRQGQHLKTWKRRYFVLLKRTNTVTGEISASLQYYKGSNFGKLRGEIEFQDGPLTIRYVEWEEAKRVNCFEISRGDFALLLQGRDDDDVSAWVCLLQSLAATPRETETMVSAGSPKLTGQDGLLTAGSLKRIRSVATMDSRGITIVAELRRILHSAKAPEASKVRNFVRHYECRHASSLRQLRDFHASATESIVRNHGPRILQTADERAMASEDGGASENQLTMDDIRAITSRHVEEALFLPVHEVIQSFMRRHYGEEDTALNRKLRWLQGKDQTYFNIPLHHVSRKEWRKASKVLSQMAVAVLPTVKYEILIGTLNEIRAMYAEEHEGSVGSGGFGTDSLETDDLIPIFTYVLASSGLDNLVSLKLLLSELTGGWAVGGALDDGTGLSIFTYAVEFINNVTIPAVLEDVFKDQITLSIDGDWRHILELDVEPTYRYGAVVRQVTQHGYNTIGSTVTRGYVLVTVNGQNVVLWPFSDISAFLKESTSPHRLAFIPANSYFKILTSNKSLWNVALVHACQRGDIASVQMLLANGADVNYVALECGGNTPLHIAVSALHFNVVSYLLQHGAKARTLGELGRSALHMVGSPCTLPSPSTPSTSMALRQSAMTKFRPQDKIVLIIKKLLNHGASMDAMDLYGNTPLMLLAEKGCVPGIDVLIEANGNVDLNARSWQHGMSALALAAREGHIDVVEALLDYGVQPDVDNLQGDTPLHLAAARACTDICRILVEKGCPVDVRNCDGLTPLMVAVSKGQEMVRSDAERRDMSGVRRIGAQSKTQSQRPKAPLRRAHIDDASVLETIELLLHAGADLYAVCHKYRLPLHYAGLYGGSDVFQYLLKKMKSEGDGHMRDIYGRTAHAMAEAKKAEDAELKDRLTTTSRSSGGDGEGDEDEEEVYEEDEDEDDAGAPSEFQRFLDQAAQPPKSGEGNIQVVNNLVTEDGAETGVRVIVAGSLEAIAEALFRCDDYNLEDAAALLWTCDTASYPAIIDVLRAKLKKCIGTLKIISMRRVVLQALDVMVQRFVHNLQLDGTLCRCIYDCCDDVFPFDDDPQCTQWLSTTSLLPMFIEAVRARRLYDLRAAPSPCDGAYSSIRRYLRIAKQESPSLRFLDDELYTSTFGMEVISESMRRRLSIAGVWNGDTSRSFLVQKPTDSPAATLDRKTISIPPSRAAKLAPPIDRVTRLWLLDVDPSILAQQITVFEHYLFSQIRVAEVLTSKKSAETTPAYDRLRQLHNHISIWVVNQILSRDDVEQRGEILAHFVQVAAVCLSPLQNFDGFMAIMNATNDSSIFRLKKTWGRLQPQVRDQWHDLKKYTENGARSLNKLMKDARPPSIPYLGSVIQNVIAIQEYPDLVDGDLLNFKKIRVLGSVVSRFQAVQSSPYLLPTDKRVLDHLCSTLTHPDADSCFHRSLKIEPRVPTTAPSTA